MPTAYSALTSSPWVEFMPGREGKYSLGIVGPNNALTRLNGLFQSGRTEHAQTAIAQLGTQRYGVFGAPWGNVPEALDKHLRSVVGVDQAILEELSEDVAAGKIDQGGLYAMEEVAHTAPTSPDDAGPPAAPGSSSTPGSQGHVPGDFSEGHMDSGNSMGPSPSSGAAATPAIPGPTKKNKHYTARIENLTERALAGERDEGIKLAEVSPGVFEWTGWENDPEYRAYIEGIGAQRSQAARGRMAAAPQQMAGPTMKGSGAYSQLEQLYATQDSRAPTRPGQTEATKPGAVAYSDTPGFIGQQSAQGQQQRGATKTALDQFYESFGYGG